MNINTKNKIINKKSHLQTEKNLSFTDIPLKIDNSFA